MAEGETRSEPYFPVLDALRLLAVIGVVWLHVHVEGGPPLAATKELGRFAVPFFACAAVYYAFGTKRRHPATTLAAYIAARFWRVYFVFLAWSAIYLGARWANALFVSHTGMVKTSLLDFLWNGEAFQLWFLAFIFPVSVGAFAVAMMVRALPALRVPLVLVLAVLGVALSIAPEPAMIRALGYAALNGFDTLPACFLALAFALTEKPEPAEKRSYGPWLLVGVVLVLAWFTVGMILNFQRWGIAETLGGFGFFLLGLGWSSPNRRPIFAHLGALAYGIYLVHLLFLETLEQLLPKIGWDERAMSVEIAVFAATLAGSFALVELLRASRWTRWLVG